MFVKRCNRMFCQLDGCVEGVALMLEEVEVVTSMCKISGRGDRVRFVPDKSGGDPKQLSQNLDLSSFSSAGVVALHAGDLEMSDGRD